MPGLNKKSVRGFNWEEFQAAVRLLKSGVEELPFRDVILAATGHRILPFSDLSRIVVRDIKECIMNNLAILSDRIYTQYSGRSNELGNYLERELIAMLNTQLPFRCEIPKTKAGHVQAVGYPDGIIISGDVILYFDIKVYQAKTKGTTLRSFYYQPTNLSKIHHDASHFIIGFEVESLGVNNSSPFRIVDYSIVDLHQMTVSFKAEFNTNNRNLYALREP